jgi:hypothetical protein
VHGNATRCERTLAALVFNLTVDVNAGVGYGLTPGSDRLMYKMIIGTDCNAICNGGYVGS